MMFSRLLYPLSVCVLAASLSLCVVNVNGQIQPTTTSTPTTAGPVTPTQCGVDGISLSALTSTTDLTFNDKTYDYYWNPCGTVNNAACSSHTGSTICQIYTVTKMFYGLAYLTPAPAWSSTTTVNGTTVAAKYANGDPCTGSGYSGPRTVTAKFICSQQAGSGFTLIQTPGAQCDYTATYQTPLACGGGGGGSSGLSGGSIFCIILLCGLFLYIVIGVLYKTFSLGATGAERFPNIDFWKDLPGLIKDGFSFTYNKLRGLCGGGGAAKSTGTYDSL